MKSNDWPVTAGDVRPAKPDGTCFYCGQSIGQQHAEKCVCRRKTVVVRISVEHVVKVPEDWDQHMIEFNHNESSSCFDNRISELSDLIERLDASDAGCSCNLKVQSEFVREATEDDETACRMFIEKGTPVEKIENGDWLHFPTWNVSGFVERDDTLGTTIVTIHQEPFGTAQIEMTEEAIRKSGARKINQ